MKIDDDDDDDDDDIVAPPPSPYPQDVKAKLEQFFSLFCCETSFQI